jgi:fermentation-respiration switch protein FrsA (DUF1100 family)
VVWSVIGAVAAVVVFDILIRIRGVLCLLPILERLPPFAVEPTPPHPVAENVEFTTPDGVVLRGSLLPPVAGKPQGLVIFCPELEGDHWSAAWYCRGLLDAGFAVLAFDFRNQGDSDSVAGYVPLHWLTEFEVTDTLTAVAYAQSRADLRDLPIGMFGISRGGGAALAATARCPAVRCVACEGVYSISSLALHYTLRWVSLYFPPFVVRLLPIWHLRLTLTLSRWISQVRRHCRYITLESWLPLLRDRPVLMIADGRDTYVLPEVSETLFKAFPKSSAYWLAKGAKHNMARETDPTEYDRRIIEFFSELSSHAAHSASPLSLSSAYSHGN